MTVPERIAVVTPRRECRAHAERWSRLLGDRARTFLCDAPGQAEARDADLVVVDADCPDLDDWIRRETEGGRAPDSIVVFGDHDAGVTWGPEGTDVLAAISDYLDRRELLRDADEFLEDLRESNERLAAHRRRFARLAVEQAETLRGANRSLAREVEELTRMQELTRVFTREARGDDELADTLAETVGRVLDAEGAALCRGSGDDLVVEGRWRISQRNAAGIAAGHPSTRKGRHGCWLPIEGAPAPGYGLALLFREKREPGAGGGPDHLRSVCTLLAEGLAMRASTAALLARKAQGDRILQTLRGGLLKIDGSGRIVLANPACAEILETTVEALEGKTAAEVFPPHAREILDAAPSAEGRLDDLETYVITARGRHVSVSLRASTLQGEAEDGTLVLLSDLSRRKEVEEEVRRVDRLAALGRLSAGVAHEVRNPLAGIRTTAEILRGRIDDDDDRARFVDVILEETARLDRIVGSLLQFAKPPEPRPEPADLVALLSRAARLAAGRAADRGVTVRVAEAARLPSARVDRDQILQVVLNLVLNAVDAAPAGGEIRLSAETAPPDSVRILVEDDGPGVPAAVRERIFDPFFTTKAGGTGLGLSISQGIVARHSGSLRMEETGTGTRAVVTLPSAAARNGRGNPWQTS
ncbi:MAG TPA: ATP-binding protein [bacterium]|nr:ATP-binding protein [bacterium]